jgi:hypothetical protein
MNPIIKHAFFSQQQCNNTNLVFIYQQPNGNLIATTTTLYNFSELKHNQCDDIIYLGAVEPELVLILGNKMQKDIKTQIEKHITSLSKYGTCYKQKINELNTALHKFSEYMKTQTK